MGLLHLILVAVIQGVTEFLPVSSSGHLVLLPRLGGFADQGLAIDVAVHVGTLGAVMLYFRAEVAMALTGLADLARRRATKAARLALALIVATIPVILAGLVLKLTGWVDALRSVAVIGWAMLGFGLLLWWADRSGASDKSLPEFTGRAAWKLGLWQALALIPGTSRSGIVITGARRMGFDRTEAARISMLMSIPTIIASGTLLGLDVVGQADAQLMRDAGIAALFAFVAALGALALMMRLLRAVSYTPYVIYRVILGAALLVIAYG